MSEQAAMTLQRVTKRIGAKTIIDSLSFEVLKGEVFGFLGPNGAGKTTTIRMMVGLMSMSSGDILIHGKSISRQFEQAIGHVGAIVENPEMYKYLTGYQNLIHYARMVPGIGKQRIDQVVALVGLKHRIHEKVKRYSLGMRQRLGVAQAILHHPSVLILDEPTNGLDPAGIRELRDYLRNLAREEGTAIVVSSHLLAEMELMCDRVAIIRNGKLMDVRLLKDYVAEDETLTVYIEVDEAEKAVRTLKDVFPDLNISFTGQTITVQTDRERIPEMNAVLVRDNVRVYSIRTPVKTLEDKFLEMTRGEEIV